MEEKIIFFIDAHYAEPLSIGDVASSVGFSKYYVSRQFKKITNRSFCDYLNQKRIAVAQELLTSTEMSVTDISLQAGFQSISSFNRIFRAEVGCSPTEYRTIGYIANNN